MPASAISCCKRCSAYSGNDFIPGLSLRVTDIEGTPWFLAADVCAVLGTRTDNIKAILGEARVKPLPNSGLRGRPPLVITESGLYRLVMRSNKPEAAESRIG